MNTIKHTEYKHNGRRVILDTCELAPGKYETMLLYPNGHEIDCRTARTEADAIADFDELLTAYPADTKPAAPKPLTGKYAKLRDDFEWKCFNRRWVICFHIPGQAYKRETAAEAMTKALADMGYDALTYCAID